LVKGLEGVFVDKEMMGMCGFIVGFVTGDKKKLPSRPEIEQ